MPRNAPISRRDVLKLLSLLPAIYGYEAIRRALPTPLRAGPTGNGPGVIVIVLDALSALNMSLYGYPRKTTPNMERFARRSNVYHAHYSTSNFTSSGTASLLTGTYPWTHRTFHYQGSIQPEKVDANIFRYWGDAGPRIGYTQNPWVDILFYQFSRWLDMHVDLREFAHGENPLYSTLFKRDPIVSFKSTSSYVFEMEPGISSVPLLSLVRKAQLVLGKKAMDETYVLTYPNGIARTLNDVNVYFLLEELFDGLMGFLEKVPPSALAYIHLYPPHHPYAPRKEFVEAMQDDWRPAVKSPAYFLDSVNDEIETATQKERDQYDAYIATVDSEFGRLIDSMERNGIFDHNYVVLTSDHGDLYERGVVGHVNEYLYEPLVRIPLIISSPGQKLQHDVFSPTSGVDIVPTLLSLAGRPVPLESEGVLLPGLGGVDDFQRSIFSIDTKSTHVRGPIRTATVSLRKGNYKLIAYLGYEGMNDGFELFDLQNDPEEMNNLVQSKPETLKDLRNEIDLKLREVNRPYLSPAND